MKKLARVKLSRSEAGAHTVFKQFGQSVDVKICKTNLVNKPGFPYVSFTNWLRYLVEYDQLEHIVGVQKLDDMQPLLRTFWDRFQKLHPEHIIATRDDPEFQHDMCLPVLLHGDEGRGLKKKQLMVLSIHGVIGKGSTHSNANIPDLDDPSGPLRLNMKGHTQLNHFLHSVLPISLYNETPENLYHILDLQAKELASLFEKGVVIRGRRYFLCCIGVKGDAPFLAKSGLFERSLTRRPTKASSKKPCQGLCHLCLAGKEDYVHPCPFEEYGVENPQWLATMGVEPAFTTPSPLLQIPFECGGTTERFWRYDLFHNWHSGMGKYFATSAICTCMELIPDTIDGAFAFITNDFKTWCAESKESPYHRKLTKSLFGLKESFQDCPDAGWSKGDFTRVIVKWFSDFAARNVVGKTQDQLYLKCVSLAELSSTVFHGVFV